MKFIFLFFLSSMILPVFSCSYFMEKDSVLYEGYTISYSSAVTDLLKTKGYERVFEEADFKIEFEVKIFQQSNFERALIQTLLFHKSFSYSETAISTCLTTRCSVADLLKSFRRLFKKMKRTLPSC